MDNMDIFSLSLAAVVSTTGALVTGADWFKVAFPCTHTIEMAGPEDTGTAAETKELPSTSKSFPGAWAAVTEASEVVIPEAESVMPVVAMLETSTADGGIRGFL